ncbi:hypothetical protein PHMEG_00039959, partial [Phytophthora megakarya]
MTRALAAKLARRPNGGHILVNAVAPGLIPSKMTEGIPYVTGKSFENVKEEVPTERLGEDSDMAGGAIFLASKASAWISGQVITCDGGMVGAAETGLISDIPRAKITINTMSSLNAAKLFDVKDKVVVITGGGRGIGKMIADGFVQNGAKVYIASRNLEACQATADELNEKGPGVCIALKVDLTNEDECKAFADKIIERETRLDVLINNSGDGSDTPVENTPAAGS